MHILLLKYHMAYTNVHISIQHIISALDSANIAGYSVSANMIRCRVSRGDENKQGKTRTVCRKGCRPSSTDQISDGSRRIGSVRRSRSPSCCSTRRGHHVRDTHFKISCLPQNG